MQDQLFCFIPKLITLTVSTIKWTEFPQLDDLLRNHGADGEEELGQAQFAQLLQSVLQELAEELSQKNVVSIQNMKVVNGSKLRQVFSICYLKNIFPYTNFNLDLLYRPIPWYLHFEELRIGHIQYIKENVFAIEKFNYISNQGKNSKHENHIFCLANTLRKCSIHVPVIV